jgi:hypothetical protein
MADANRFWKETAVKEKIPFPQIHYVSPLTRTLQTANLTWSDNPRIRTSKGFFVKEASIPISTPDCLTGIVTERRHIPMYMCRA